MSDFRCREALIASMDERAERRAMEQRAAHLRRQREALEEKKAAAAEPDPPTAAEAFRGAVPPARGRSRGHAG